MRSHITLALCTILHGFTHAYGTLLVPLYLLMVSDLHLSRVRQATALVAIYGLVYSLFSYPAGMLADRFDRRVLLGIGLLGNAAAIGCMGLTHSYPMLVGLAVIGGLCGNIFHPAANALVPAHYPENPGMAIGLLGVGSGVGFFSGPQFAGWRAQAARWQWDHVSQWQKPCIELGVLGLIVGVIFLFVAKEPRGRTAKHVRRPATPGLLPRVFRLSLVLGFRDFAGVAAISLASIYLQKAHGLTVKQAGLMVGGMMLLSVLVNPLAVYMTPGKRRLPALVAVLLCGGAVVMWVPFVPLRWTFLFLCVFQTFQLGSYAISDAAMLERVDPDLRGRVVGIFLTFAGTFSGLGPWIMGGWTDLLGERAKTPIAYAGPFATLGVMMWVAAFCPRIIGSLGPVKRGAEIEAKTEVMPGTVGVTG